MMDAIAIVNYTKLGTCTAKYYLAYVAVYIYAR